MFKQLKSPPPKEPNKPKYNDFVFEFPQTRGNSAENTFSFGIQPSESIISQGSTESWKSMYNEASAVDNVQYDEQMDVDVDEDEISTQPIQSAPSAKFGTNGFEYEGRQGNTRAPKVDIKHQMFDYDPNKSWVFKFKETDGCNGEDELRKSSIEQENSFNLPKQEVQYQFVDHSEDSFRNIEREDDDDEIDLNEESSEEYDSDEEVEQDHGAEPSDMYNSPQHDKNAEDEHEFVSVEKEQFVDAKEFEAQLSKMENTDEYDPIINDLKEIQKLLSDRRLTAANNKMNNSTFKKQLNLTYTSCNVSGIQENEKLVNLQESFERRLSLKENKSLIQEKSQESPFKSPLPRVDNRTLANEEIKVQKEEINDLHTENKQLKEENERLNNLLEGRDSEICSLKQALQSLAENYRNTLQKSMTPTKKTLKKGIKGHVQCKDDKSIRLYCRVRPIVLPSEQEENTDHITFKPSFKKNASDDLDESRKVISITKFTQKLSNNKNLNYNYMFQFDRVFEPHHDQSSVFEELKPMIKKVFTGERVTCFAYGNTGSGKTYTIEGDQNYVLNENNHISIRNSDGLMQRAINQIFKTIESREAQSVNNDSIQRLTGVSFNVPEVEFQVYLTVVEIYNDKAHDLLSNKIEQNIKKDYSNDKENNKAFSFEKNKKGSFQKPKSRVIRTSDAEKHRVYNSREVFQLLKQASEKRSTASTLNNERSSRSHCVFQLGVKTINSQTGSIIQKGRLSIIDLAGFEALETSIPQADKLLKTQNSKVGHQRRNPLSDMNSFGTYKSKKQIQYEQIKKLRNSETKHINKSLSSLSSVLRAIIQQDSYIPYRNSALTQWLMEDLKHEQSKIVLIINVTPKYSILDKTIGSLQFVRNSRVEECVC